MTFMSLVVSWQAGISLAALQIMQTAHKPAGDAITGCSLHQAAYAPGLSGSRAHLQGQLQTARSRQVAPHSSQAVREACWLSCRCCRSPEQGACCPWTGGLPAAVWQLLTPPAHATQAL